MKYKMTISVLVATALALTSLSAVAGKGQGGGQGGGAQAADRMQQIDRDRSYDRDRQQDRDRIDAPDQVRDRDRLMTHDPATMRDQDIYGHELMTEQERKQYRKQLGEADSPEKAGKFQAQHEERMQKRALERGVDLVPPGQGPVYGGEYMTVQERNQYREQLRLLETDPERDQFMAKHREQMNQRARAMGYEIEEAE
jgi:hypothetical protein